MSQYVTFTQLASFGVLFLWKGAEMEQTITMQALVQCAALIMGIWGFFKVVMEIIKQINARHDKEQLWDKTAENLVNGRQEIMDKYDVKLAELDNKIDENHADTEAKIQELKAEMIIQLECIQAILKGLEQLNCNGPVTEAKDTLEKHLREKAYE